MVFFGASAYVIPILQILDFDLVVTTEPKPTDSVRKFCTENKIPCLFVADRFNEEIIMKLRSLNTPIAVLASFGIIIPQQILDLFPKGILNIHPSLLPKYRGPTPIQSAILNGDEETGVTVIKLDAELDHGPIFAQKKRKLKQSDTSDILYNELFRTGAELIKTHLHEYLSGNLQLIGQIHPQATYTERLTRESGYFEINNPPTPEKLERMIKAYYPWPGVWTRFLLEGGRLQRSESHDSFKVKTKILKFLPENTLQVEGKKPMTIKDFVNGYPQLQTTIEKILNLKS